MTLTSNHVDPPHAAEGDHLAAKVMPRIAVLKAAHAGASAYVAHALVARAPVQE